MKFKVGDLCLINWPASINNGKLVTIEKFLGHISKEYPFNGLKWEGGDCPNYIIRSQSGNFNYEYSALGLAIDLSVRLAAEHALQKISGLDLNLEDETSYLLTN